MPLNVVAPVFGEEGQPASEVGSIAVVVEITSGAPSSVLAMRKQEDGVGPSGCKKWNAPMSLCALRQTTGLMLDLGHLSSEQVVPPAQSVVEAPASIVATPTPSPPPTVPVQEATPTTVVNMPTTLAGLVMVPSSIVAAPLLSAGVANVSASVVLPPPSSAPPVPPSVVLVMASPSSSSRPHVSLDHLYTFSGADSSWGCKL